MQVLEPRTYRWSRLEYRQMRELGWFIDKRVELLDGEVVEMPIPGLAHCKSTDRSCGILRGVIGPSFWVMMQMPLNLSPFSEPLPDVAVVEGSRDDYEDTPTTALLVVEVSDSSLANDRFRKASLYACSHIADYWIVSPGNRHLEVYREPVADGEQPYGFRYASQTIWAPADYVSPLARPQARIKVEDLLP